MFIFIILMKLNIYSRSDLKNQFDKLDFNSAHRFTTYVCMVTLLTEIICNEDVKTLKSSDSRKLNGDHFSSSPAPTFTTKGILVVR